MQAPERAPRDSEPRRPRSTAGRHAKPGHSAAPGESEVSQPFVDSDEEREFDFSRPLLVDVGRAAVIAEWLRESGYPRCTADVVIAELSSPERERSSIGRFAADQLRRAGWRP